MLGTIEQGDTILHDRIDEVTVVGKLSRKQKRKIRQFSRLEKKVRNVYPLAKAASVKLSKYNEIYLDLETDRDRKRYIKNIEKELFEEYEETIRKMTITEGRILIRLIDREIGNTSFEIIKEFRGGFSAFFWQSIARLFGNDLKDNYNPEERDRWIEMIIHRIERENYEKNLHRHKSSSIKRAP